MYTVVCAVNCSTSTVQHCTVLHSKLHHIHCAVLYSSAQQITALPLRSTVLYCTVQYCTANYTTSTVQHCTGLHSKLHHIHCDLKVCVLVFLTVTPYSLVGACQCFEDPWCLHFQGKNGCRMFCQPTRLFEVTETWLFLVCVYLLHVSTFEVPSSVCRNLANRFLKCVREK